MKNVHWGRFALTLLAAFAAGFAVSFGQSLSGAESQVSPTATAAELLKVVNIAFGVGVIGGLKGTAVALGAFFVKPQKPEESE